jgi:hypothetical protein
MGKKSYNVTKLYSAGEFFYFKKYLLILISDYFLAEISDKTI